MKSVVKEMKMRYESREETERCKREVLHEAEVINSLGVSLSLLKSRTAVSHSSLVPRPAWFTRKTYVVKWSPSLGATMFSAKFFSASSKFYRSKRIS